MLKERHTVDSVFIHDSIFIHEGGDTVVHERWRTCFRDRIVHDTVREHTTDTIIKRETEEKVVEVTPAKGVGTGWTVALTLLAVIVLYMVIKYGLKIL
jgi:hypothetical protein